MGGKHLTTSSWVRLGLEEDMVNAGKHGNRDGRQAGAARSRVTAEEVWAEAEIGGSFNERGNAVTRRLRRGQPAV